jgi:hypothetical protein
LSVVDLPESSKDASAGLRRDAATASFVPVKPEGDIYRSAVIPDLWLRAEWLWPEKGEFPDVVVVLKELEVL